MKNEEIVQQQEFCRSMLGDLDAVAEKIRDFRRILQQIDSEFEAGNTVSADCFEGMIKIAQEYYTLDMKLKELLPDVADRESFDIAQEKETLQCKLEELDREIIRNSVNRYFELQIADAERADELEMTKDELRQLLADPDALDVAAIRPYTSILQIVEDQDLELPDELMDEIDDTFSKPFVRAVLRGKVYYENGTGAGSHHEAQAFSISGHAQTLE